MNVNWVIEVVISMTPNKNGGIMLNLCLEQKITPTLIFIYILKKMEKAQIHSEYQLITNLSKYQHWWAPQTTSRLASILPLSIQDKAPWYSHCPPPLGIRNQGFYTSH